MKDGLYHVTANVGGRLVAAEAIVRNGVFQGLGELSGMVGVFDFTVPADAADGVDAGTLPGLRWSRADLGGADPSAPPSPDGPSPALLAIADALRDIRRQVHALRLIADQQCRHAELCRTNVQSRWQDFRRMLQGDDGRTDARDRTAFRQECFDGTSPTWEAPRGMHRKSGMPA